MKLVCRTATIVGIFMVSAGIGSAQTPAAQQAPATDVYHVMFVKAAPGQAAAVAKTLQTPDPKDPMGSHFILLRHQEGADWDYCLIQHVGAKPTVEIPPPTPDSATPTMAWHDDSFVSGPAWPEFQRVMGLTGDQTGNAVYVVSSQRAVPGHRAQLLESLNRPAPPSKVTVGNLVMTHLEGGDWQYLALSKYNSWQDLAADRSAAAGAGDAWGEIRQHSASHADTIADRVR
jgi:hypothetical protein